MIWDPIIEHLARVIGSTAILVTTFWKGDDLISSAGRKLLAVRINAAIASPSRTEAKVLSDVVRAYFAGNLPAWRFVLNVFVFTIASMLLLMLIYVPLTPGFFSSLLVDQLQRSEVVTQFLLDGLTKTFVANYVGFSIFAMRSVRDDFDPLKSLFVDIVVKILVFIAATAAIYVAYAHINGAFTGSARRALLAVGPTIVTAAKFQDLTAVYLYSLCISSLPLYLTALVQTMADHPGFSAAVRSIFFWLPFDEKPIRALAVVFGCFFGFFAVLASTFATALARWH
jgi:hypothetical protein